MVSREGSLDLKRPRRSCWRVAGEADLEDAQLLARRFFMAALLSHLECRSGGAVCTRPLCWSALVLVRRVQVDGPRRYWAINGARSRTCAAHEVVSVVVCVTGVDLGGGKGVWHLCYPAGKIGGADSAGASEQGIVPMG